MTLRQMVEEYIPTPSDDIIKDITKPLGNTLDLIEHCNRAESCDKCEFCAGGSCMIYNPLDWRIDLSAYEKLGDGWHLKNGGPKELHHYVVSTFNPFANETSLYFIGAHSELEAQYCAFLKLYGENTNREFDSSDFYTVSIDENSWKMSDELFERYNTSLEQMKTNYPDVDEKYNK